MLRSISDFEGDLDVRVEAGAMPRQEVVGGLESNSIEARFELLPGGQHLHAAAICVGLGFS